MENKANDFIKNEVLKIENRIFFARILGSAIGYALITMWLNSIRTTASLWFVWILIIIQFSLYFWIFVNSYRRSKVLGLNKNLAWIVFSILAVLGRVNNWELLVIPLLIVVMIIFSARNKNVSDEIKHLLPEKEI
jgi:hypothetical protein